MFPCTQNGKAFIFEEGCAVGLSGSAGVSVLLDSDFYLCQYQGLWMCVHSVRGFSGCIGEG